MSKTNSETSPEQTAAIEALRAHYRAARAGSPVDPHAIVAAIGVAIAHGADVQPIIRAFEPHAWIALRNLRGVDGAYVIRFALATGGMHAAIRAASLLGWTDVWTAAMTAHYGLTGTHESRLGPDGCPTQATLAEFPEMAETMAMAAERVESILGWYERTDHATRWQYVVEPRVRHAA